MGKRSSGPLPVEADRLKAAVQSWRESRNKVGPMPADLWQCAMGLAVKHGVCRIARAIGVDYSALRASPLSRIGHLCSPKVDHPEFREMPLQDPSKGPGRLLSPGGSVGASPVRHGCPVTLGRGSASPSQGDHHGSVPP